MESLIAQLHAPLMKLEPEDAEGFEPGFAAKIIIAGRDAGRIGIIFKSNSSKAQNIVASSRLRKLKETLF